MAEKTLIAKIREDEEDPQTLLVTSPVVGMADGAPRKGVFLNAFDRIITVKVLHQRYVLRLPRNVHGWVIETFIPNGFTPVAYGEPIARLDPRALGATAEGSSTADGTTAAAGEGEDAGLITIRAPSEGIFYRRPSADSPSYVEVGSSISSGAILGLVEIMKCFHQITYGGPDLPENGEVTQILAEDTSEVHFDQALFQVKPVE